MSLALKGHKVSLKTRKKMSKSGKGKHKCENNGNWQGGKSFEPYDTKFNNTYKEFIRKRDNYTCQLCGKTQKENRVKLSVHHIDYDKMNTQPSNNKSLCRSCNAKVNTDREEWKKFFQEKMRRKYGYIYHNKNNKLIFK